MNALLEKVQIWLTELDIATDVAKDYPTPGRNCLAVSRRGIKALCPAETEQISYILMVQEIWSFVGNKHLSWVGGDANYIYLDTM